MEMKPKLYLIGNGHLDPVWLWQLPEGLSEIKATFRSALDRMKEFPGYIFTSACASYYAWIEANEPAMFEEIKARVEEGRWAIAGGMWVQPDCNIPAGESFARHLLISQRYFREKFGMIAKVGYNVDSFGHNGMLPQILKKGGMVGYIYQRPNGKDENPQLQDDLILWESPDGTKLPTYRIPTGYGESYFKLDVYKELVENFQLPYLAFYGVGNHGGGPTIKRLTDLEERMAAGESMEYSSPDRYFDHIISTGIAEKLPVVSTDLQHHASGCYSADSSIKRLNRQAESSLLTAEKFNVLRCHALKEKDDHLQRLTDAWKKLLFNQFHDILTGCCIRAAADDARCALGGVIDRAEDTLHYDMQKLSWSINTHRDPTDAKVQKTGRWWEKEGEGAPFVVFNPHGFPVKAMVQINNSSTVYTMGAICDEEGNFIPFQTVRGYSVNYESKSNYLFEAEVPAYGYRTYYFYRYQQNNPAVSGGARVLDNVLENKNLRVEFNREQGWIEKLIDKRTGKTVNAGPLARAILVDDTANDTWAHKVFTFNGQAGYFTDAQYRPLDNGPLRAGIRVTTSYGASTLCQDYYLTHDGDAVEVECRLFFADRFRFLKLCFAADVKDPKVTYAMPYGYLTKACDGMENPAQCWAAIRDGESGIAVATDCKYSFCGEGNELRFVAARSCCYADHFGKRDGLEDFLDLGDQKFRYMIYPFQTLSGGEMARKTALLQMPLRGIHETYHDGPLASKGGWVSGIPANVMLEAVKPLQEGSGFAARLYETDGKAAEFTLELLGKSVKLRFTPHEIKTVCFPAEGAAVETNLLEDYR